MNAMHQHLPSIGAHAVNEIQCSLDHLLLDRNSNRQIEQAEHQAILPVRHQIIRMALSNAPHPVPYRHTMVGPAGMNDSPAILARNNSLIINAIAYKQARIYLDHTSITFVSTSPVSSTPAISNLSTSISPEISSPQHLKPRIPPHLLNHFKAFAHRRLILQEAVRHKIKPPTRAQYLRSFTDKPFTNLGGLDASYVKRRVGYNQVETL